MEACADTASRNLALQKPNTQLLFLDSIGPMTQNSMKKLKLKPLIIQGCNVNSLNQLPKMSIPLALRDTGTGVLQLRQKPKRKVLHV